MGAPIRLMYRGHETTVKRICELKGLAKTTFYERYRAEDKPLVISERFLARVKQCRQKKTLTLDGVETKYTDLKRDLGVSSATISSRISKFGRNLTTEMFARGVVGKKPAKQPAEFTAIRPKPGRGDINAIPGPTKWELENLPSAGANGFCKVEIHNSLNLSYGTNLPVSSDMPL